MKVHSWCCIVCGFGQMHNDMYASLQYSFLNFFMKVWLIYDVSISAIQQSEWNILYIERVYLLHDIIIHYIHYIHCILLSLIHHCHFNIELYLGYIHCPKTPPCSALPPVFAASKHGWSIVVTLPHFGENSGTWAWNLTIFKSQDISFFSGGGRSSTCEISKGRDQTCPTAVTGDIAVIIPDP